MCHLERSQALHISKVVACRPGHLQEAHAPCFRSQQPSGHITGHATDTLYGSASKHSEHSQRHRLRGKHSPWRGCHRGGWPGSSRWRCPGAATCRPPPSCCRCGSAASLECMVGMALAASPISARQLSMGLQSPRRSLWSSQDASDQLAEPIQALQECIHVCHIRLQDCQNDGCRALRQKGLMSARQVPTWSRLMYSMAGCVWCR